MSQLPRDQDSPFSLPSDEPEIMPVDYPELNGNVDCQEAYDEGLENNVDFDPYLLDDDPIKSVKRTMRSVAGGTEWYSVNHDRIRRWSEYRYGHPARLSYAERNGLERGGLLIAFEDNEPDADIELISWREFFRIFDGNGLAFVYKQFMPNGDISHFYQIVYKKDVARITNARRCYDQHA